MQEGTSLVWRNAFFSFVLTIGDVVDSTADTYTYTYTYTCTYTCTYTYTYTYTLIRLIPNIHTQYTFFCL